jgi:hypothetical protein
MNIVSFFNQERTHMCIYPLLPKFLPKTKNRFLHFSAQIDQYNLLAMRYIEVNGSLQIIYL